MSTIPEGALHVPARPGARLTQLAVLVAVSLPFLFIKLDFPLLDPDEGLYASIAQEMLSRGDWVIPHVNGLPYLERPPLYFRLSTRWRASSTVCPHGQNSGSSRGSLAACPLDDVELELSSARDRYDQAPTFEGSVGLIVTPPAKRHQVIEVKVGTAPRALDNVVHVESTPHAASLAAPARSREDLLSDRPPLGDTRSRAAYRARSSRLSATTCAQPDRCLSPQHAGAP